MIIAALIQTWTRGPWAFLGTRVMLGAGLAFEQVSASTLTTEIAHPRQRAQKSPVSSKWYGTGDQLRLNASLSGVFGLQVAGVGLLQVISPGIQFLGLLIVPESPRCLTSKGRKEEVYAVLVKYHANGTIDDPLVRLEFDEIIQVLDEEKEIAKSTGFAEFFQT